MHRKEMDSLHDVFATPRGENLKILLESENSQNACIIWRVH